MKRRIGTKSTTVERKSGRTLRRLTLYLPVELTKELQHYCVDHEQDMSTAITDAVTRLLAAKK